MTDTDTAPTEVEPKLKRRRRWPYYVGGGIVVLFLLLLLLPGPLLRYGIKSGLEDFGFKDVEVTRSDASMFALLFGIGGVSAVSPDGRQVQLTDLSTDFSWPDIFNKHIRLEEIRLKGLRLDVTLEEDGRLLISGLPLSVQDTKTVAQADDGDADDGGWTIGAQRAEITDSRVTYRQKDVVLPIDVERLSISGVDGKRARVHGRIDLVGKIDNSPVVISGTMRPTDDPITVDIEVELTGLVLGNIAGFAGENLRALDGQLDLKLAVSAAIGDDGSFQSTIKGPISFREFKAARDNVDVSVPGLRWQGQVAASDQLSSLEGELTLDGLALKQDEMSVALGPVNWKGKANADPEAATIDGSINLKSLSIEQGEQVIAIGATNWVGKVLMQLAAEARNLNVDGQLALASTDLSAAGLGVKTGALDWTGVVDLPLAGAEKGKLQGILNVAAVAVSEQASQLMFDQESVSAKLSGQLPNPGAGGPVPLRLAFLVEGDGAKLSHGAAGIENFSISKLSVKGNTDLSLTQGLPNGAVQSDIALTGVKLALQDDAVTISDESVTLRGAYRLAAGNDGQVGTIAGDIDLAVSGLDVAAKAQGLDKATFEKLSYKGKFDAAIGDVMSAVLDGLFSIEKAELALPKLGVDKVNIAKLDWQGTNQVTPTITAKGKLKVGQTSLRASDYDLRQKAIEVVADVVVDPKAKNGLTLNASINATGSAVDDKGGAKILRVDNAKLSDLKIDKVGVISIPALQVHQINALALAEDNWLATVAKLSLTAAKLGNDGSFAAETIAVDTLKSSIVRDKNGVVGLPSGGAERRQKAASAQADGTLPDISVGEFKLTGNTEITFQDNTTDPKVKLKAAPIDLTVKNIATKRPDENMTVALKMAIGEFTKIALNGKAKPFAKARDVDAKLNIEDLDLPTFSPYAVQFGGMQLHTGRLDAELGGRVVKENVKAELKALLDNVRLKSLEPRQIKLSDKASVPLETALNLLRDDDGAVRLTIPIEGSLSDPDFKIDAIINRAIGSAVFGAVKVLFPPALLMSALAKGSKGSLGFPPVVFDAGDAGLPAGEKNTMEKLANFMAERPGAALSLCGVATVADLQMIAPDAVDVMVANSAADKAKAQIIKKAGSSAETQSSTAPADKKTEEAEKKTPAAAAIDEEKIREELSALASARSAAIKGYLVKTKGINAKRLFECRPQVELQGDGGPRVEMSL